MRFAFECERFEIVGQRNWAFRQAFWINQNAFEEAPLSDMKDPADTSGRLIAGSMVSGTSVYNLTGEKLGSVHDVMIDKMSGRIDYAILSFGGFLGIGDHFHPLPLSSLTYHEAVGGYVVDIDRDRLEGAPSYVATDPDFRSEDPTYVAAINSHYAI
jgi:hypothetical protein